MVFKHTTFNHDAENFFDAIGLTDELMNLCKERVFFATFNNALNLLDFYEDPEDAPRNLKTATGDFEKCLHLIDDQKDNVGSWQAKGGSAILYKSFELRLYIIKFYT